MRNAYVSGLGFYVPDQVVTNDDLVKKYGIDTSHEWIVQRTGIEERRFAPEGMATAEMATEAAKRAIADAGLEPDDIEMIVHASISPRHAFPGDGVYIQANLGIPGVPALDVRNQCSGYLYGLATATSMVRSGMYEHVLLIGAEIHSSALDLSTRGRTVASLFGDGAGATVISATDEPRGLKQLYLGADGRFADVLQQKVWDTRRRPYIPTDEEGRGIVDVDHMYAHMNGRLVFKHAVEKMVGSVMQVCWDEGITPADLDLVLFHQANMRINQFVQKQLGLPDEKVPHNIQRYGNTTAGTLPILLSELHEQGRLERGMKVCLAAFGSGFTWGAAIFDW